MPSWDAMARGVAYALLCAWVTPTLERLATLDEVHRAVVERAPDSCALLEQDVLERHIEAFHRKSAGSNTRHSTPAVLR